MTEQKFDISIDRVDKIPVPLLVVGLGGTGCDALLTIKETFAERYNLPKDVKGQDLPAPIKTAYLGIDSRAQRPEGLEVSEYVDISLAGIEKLLQNQKDMLTPFERTWVNPKLQSSATGNGAGTIRQAARLMLSKNYEKVNQAIKGALANIVAAKAGEADARANQVEIVVITGIGGGTGSGTFLDMCQILRDAARATTVIPAKLTGYIVMPDVSLMNVSAASGMEGPIKHNAYAALKELDFWMRVREHNVSYTMQYGTGTPIEWKEPPFDYCILMSASNVEGVPYKDGYMTVRNTIAENLMHYMATEDGVDTQYSYRQYEDNLAAIRVRKSYPLFYGYRAIGAFTKRIPKQAILYYEGSLLLNTFVPMRDDSGKLQPDRRMFTDGQGKPRAEGITGSGKQLMQDFRTNICKLPSFCYLDLNDKVKVASVQNMNPPPHNKWHNWRDQVSSPAALKAADEYLTKAWRRFSQFAESVIKDPQQGPFALEAYLDAPDGLLSFMNEILASWTNQYTKTRNQSIRQGEEMCEQSWGSFRNPPIMGKKGALEQYDHAIKTLYTYVNNCEFLEKHVAALEKLILRVKEYLRDGLKPLCASVLFLQEEFGKQDQSDAMLVQDIYNLSTVQASIDEAFKDANANDKMSSEFLGKISDIALLTQPNVDAKTSGVEFLCRKVGLQDMCKVLQSDMEEVYGSVNNQSLDTIMVANVGEDVSAQQRWMDNLASSALDSALPMFMQDAMFKASDKAPYSYMSIPQNAVEHLKYISEAFKTHDPAVEPKASSLEDHIYVLNAWDKLPLFRYGLFEDLRTAYDHDLNLKGSEGVHLVRNADQGKDYQSDWSLLPSPKPYFLFSRSSVHSEEAQYEKVHNLVERGIKCGMIKINDSQPFVSSEVNVLYADNGIAPLASETMLQMRDQIMNEKNPATGEPYSTTETARRLSSFLNDRRKVLLEENEIKPANVANVLGLEHEPCDPFDASVKADILKLEKATANHKRLCVTMTEALIYCRPDLVRALELQLPAYEEIAGYISRIGSASTVWESRKGYAETAAEMFLYLNSVLFLSTDGYRYKDKGNKYNIISPALLAEDVKEMESDLLKAVCFLADAPEDNAAKADLARMLGAAKREFTDAVDDGQMTEDEVNDLMQAAKDLIDELKETQNSLAHEARSNPSREDQLKAQIEIAAELQRILENRNRTLRNIAKGL